MATENVYLFVPNLIGYARIVLALLATYFAPSNPFLCVTTYFTSIVLDAFDGHAARILNQSSKFGAMLDMLTDRCTTMCLLATLCTFYPRWIFCFQMSMVIDMACHWVHLHVSLVKGSTSHKFIDASGNPIMRLYYTSKIVLGAMCAGNEMFYCSLYLLNFTQGPFYIFSILAVITFPIAVGKLLIALLQGYLAFVNLGMVDMNDRNAQTVDCAGDAIKTK